MSEFFPTIVGSPSDESTPEAVKLCSVAEVMKYLQETVSDDDVDPKIEGDKDREALIADLIVAVSDAITDFARREFTPTTGDIRRFAYNGSGVLNLVPCDLRTITSIKLIRGSEETDLDTDYISMRPLPSESGTFDYLIGLPSGSGEIEILGDWGMLAVPAKVKDAAIKQINLWLASYISPASSFDDDLGTIGTPAIYLAGAIQAALRPYRRTVVG